MADSANGERNNEIMMLNSMFSEHQLRDKIESLEAEKVRMKAKMEKLRDEFSAEQQKQTDLIWFYRKENDQKDKTIQKLTEENASHMASKRILKDKFDDKMKSLNDQHLCVKKELQDHLEAITLDNKSLRDFREHKRELEASLELSKKMIESERKEHTRRINDLERRNVSEKERLKKEMLRKIKETKLSLLAMTEDQLHTTTKRTIMENEQMTIELQYQSRETERLVDKNDTLRRENASLRRELELQKTTEKILATRTHFFQKLIKKLSAQLKFHESTIRELERRKGKAFERIAS
jgi:hypothetical protein